MKTMCLLGGCLVVYLFSIWPSTDPFQIDGPTTNQQTVSTERVIDWTVQARELHVPDFRLTSILPPTAPGDTDIRETLHHFHEVTTQNFETAPNQGRHRGGAHILMSSGAVKFITDSIEAEDSDSQIWTPNHSQGKSPYGLWGALGTRAAKEVESTTVATETAHPVFGFDYLAPVPESIGNESLALTEMHLLSVQLDRVYLIDASMQKLPDASEDTPYRELDAFERNAVKKFQKGEQVVTHIADDHVRIVGSLRNETTCIECHADQAEHAVLGAFTYRLRRNMSLVDQSANASLTATLNPGSSTEDTDSVIPAR